MNPLQRRAVAQPVFESLGRNALQGEEVVIDERGFVGYGCPTQASFAWVGQFHLLDAPVQLALFDAFQRILALLFVVDMQLG